MSPHPPSSHGPAPEGAAGAETGQWAGVVAVLEDITVLLHQAALAAWEIGDREGVGSEMHYLGLGVYLAEGNAAALLPPDHVMSQNWPPIGPPTQHDPAALVTSAETSLRALDPATVPGLPDLVLEVCDLAQGVPRGRTVHPGEGRPLAWLSVGWTPPMSRTGRARAPASPGGTRTPQPLAPGPSTMGAASENSFATPTTSPAPCFSTSVLTTHRP